MIRDLYAIERQIDEAPAEQRQQARMASKAKVLDFFAWADDVLSKASARSPLAEALRYAVKLNSVNPQEWLADVLDRIGKGHPINRIDELLPWKWQSLQA